MTEHSIKVPRLYKVAANIYDQVKFHGASIKNLVFQANHRNKKGIYAMVLTTIQKDIEIDYILRKSDYLSKEQIKPTPLVRILIAELLWGKKYLASDAKPIKSILAYQQIFEAFSSDVPVKSDDRAQKVLKPRYVRVNTLKMTVGEAIDAFRDEGWILKRYLGENYQEFLEVVHNMEENDFMVDMHVKELLVFPPRTQFYNHPGYKCGQIFLQDKASCLPVALLNPPPGSRVLDMCAAPGMKTTQVAAMIGDSGIVYAVERDVKRMVSLNEMVATSGSGCIQTILKDVLTVDDKIAENVEYILVDPSCSGTGITDRLELNDTPVPQHRIEKLSGFQIMVLKHAMRSFPNAKKIVYSTCSLLPEENEAVVEEVITQNPNFQLLDAHELIKSWKNYGSDAFNIGTRCIYARPEEDLSNGFFLAVFERLQEGQTNEFAIQQKIKRKLENYECDERNSEDNRTDDKDKIKKKKNKKAIQESSELKIGSEENGILNNGSIGNNNEIRVKNVEKYVKNDQISMQTLDAARLEQSSSKLIKNKRGQKKL